MYIKYRWGITVLLLVSMIPGPAFGSFMHWRPFVVRADLVPVKYVRTTMRPPALVFEKFTTDNQNPLRVIDGEVEGKEQKWGEYQFGSLRLRITRYQDLQRKNSTVRSNDGDGIWATVKSLPGRLGDLSPRENMETMGRIFTPQLDLGIEF